METGITISKADNFSQWYQQVVTKAELIDDYEISGLYPLLPTSMEIWNTIRARIQENIKDMGVKEVSFPSFLHPIPLGKEKEHFQGFAPELAWITKAGDKDLEVPVAVRPTSEAILYPYFQRHIRSHRDLPLRWNQWNSVVRWEAEQTMPFLRAREFLWQEGHTAHLTEGPAEDEVLQILELYASVYEELLAVPVVPGRKTENEKFPGGYRTLTVEAFIPTTGRGIQGATSHALGQNFSKAFDITVENEDQDRVYVWQNSWGLSTRAIGIMAMIHGDDKGLVLPPRVAEIQVVLIPVGLSPKANDERRRRFPRLIKGIYSNLKDANVRVHLDDRDECTSSVKSAYWELKGVPLRLEFGFREAGACRLRYVRRDTGSSGIISGYPIFEKQVKALLETIQKDMYNKAEASFRSRRVATKDWAKVVPILDGRKVVLIPFCEEPVCEERIKELTKSGEQELGADGQGLPSMGMKALCIPFKQPDGLIRGETKCLNPECDQDAMSWTMFGRSY